MDQRGSNFYISFNDIENTLTAIKNLAGMETIKDSSGAHFSWVGTKEFLEASTLNEAFEAWRWNIALDEEGSVVDLYFEGEKIGDDKILFDAIAPYVKEGSFIEMQGEDGALWRWVFSNGECEERYATIVWE